MTLASERTAAVVASGTDGPLRCYLPGELKEGGAHLQQAEAFGGGPQHVVSPCGCDVADFGYEHSCKGGGRYVADAMQIKPLTSLFFSTAAAFTDAFVGETLVRFDGTFVAFFPGTGVKASSTLTSASR
mmetsp:Transcript_13511/g.13713  ORF Transcript_13511/g.13713 Transcript_13511/m.13713 type:complete len:129 (-) Transcript_13511:773-1159(-)|eukprot:CAMPEP_0171327058 /NCGR_PEP_ID=MMETSP0816-20121228/117837_1 /TAXON_ID=420281 /ORGANISM="Proboscia inermis, Strain CCAP1064/1" /LENGTH=128 /DNA_ID=CAMNT_0011826681 /DNA_START=2175 /DNA_END=2561 /DNA_ORIENTATION=-